MKLRNVGLSVVVVSAALLAAVPLVRPGLPLGTDTVTHLYTLVELDDLVRDGTLFSRWLPWQNGGLGNPRFLYYPALPFYFAVPWVLVGFPHVVALRLAIAVALLAAAAGTFVWCRERYDGTAALAGAFAYELSPYLLFATYARGSFAEVTALAVAPWALWAGERSRQLGGGWIAASAMLLGVTVLCHPITGALVIGASIVLMWDGGVPKWRGVLGSVLLGLGVSAVLWLPARLERAAIGDAHAQSPGLDYRQNFLPLDWMLELPGGRMGPGYAPVALLLAAVALGVALRRRDFRGLVGLAVGWAAFTAMTLGPARPLWDVFASIARDVQFPHRLLGPGSLLLAGLAAAGAEALTHWSSHRRWPARAGLIVVLLGLASSAVALRHVPQMKKVPPLDVQFVVMKQRQAGMLGMGYQGEFLPRGISSMGRAWSVAPTPAERLVERSLPSEARLLERNYRSLRYEVRVDSPVPWTAVWATLAFPGWVAEVNGVAVETGVTEEGLLSTAVPAGMQRVVIRFGTTPERRWGALTTALSVVAALLLSVILRRAPGP